MSRGNRGDGIYLVDIDAKTGAPTNSRLVAKTLSPSWMVLSANHKFLYVVNEIDSYGDSKSGSVSAYAIDPASGGLTLLNTVNSEGAVPTYIMSVSVRQIRHGGKLHRRQFCRLIPLSPMAVLRPLRMWSATAVRKCRRYRPTARRAISFEAITADRAGT